MSPLPDTTYSFTGSIHSRLRDASTPAQIPAAPHFFPIVATLHELEKLLPSLSKGERAQMLKWIVQQLCDDFPGIDSRPEVSGGEPCIVRTRIPVWLLMQAKRLGTSKQALLLAYPSLRAEDLSNAWAYVRSHAVGIDAQIRDHEAA